MTDNYQADDNQAPVDPGANPVADDNTQQQPTPAQTVQKPWPNSRSGKKAAVSGPLSQKDRKKRIKEKVDTIIEKSPDSAKVKVKGKSYAISNVHNEGDILCCTVVGPGITDTDFRFVNPPVMVPSGTFTETVAPGGKRVKTPKFINDPKAALLQIVKDAIESVITTNT